MVDSDVIYNGDFIIFLLIYSVSKAIVVGRTLTYTISISDRSSNDVFSKQNIKQSRVWFCLHGAYSMAHLSMIFILEVDYQQCKNSKKMLK